MCIAVVDRLKGFLPEMAAANAELDQEIERCPEKYDIENVSESDEKVIEMVSILLYILTRQYMRLGHVYIKMNFLELLDQDFFFLSPSQQSQSSERSLKWWVV